MNDLNGCRYDTTVDAKDTTLPPTQCAGFKTYILYLYKCVFVCVVRSEIRVRAKLLAHTVFVTCSECIYVVKEPHVGFTF